MHNDFSFESIKLKPLLKPVLYMSDRRDSQCVFMGIAFDNEVFFLDPKAKREIRLDTWLNLPLRFVFHLEMV